MCEREPVCVCVYVMCMMRYFRNAVYAGEREREGRCVKESLCVCVFM